MKLKVTQANLNKALSVVSRVSAGRGSLPILSNLLITAENNKVSLAATNLEIAITYTLAGKVEEPGSITVPGRLMNDFVSSLPDDTIDLSLTNMALNIKTNHYESTINGVSADEFPSLPAIQNPQPFSIPAARLRSALQQTVLAASSDEARQVLTGVYMHTHEGNLYFAATDSYRLAEKNVAPNSSEFGLLVPASALQEVLRVVPDEQTEVSISYDEGQVMFEYDDIRIISRLVDGNYPNYRQLIPPASDIDFTIARDDFINITKVSSLFARESAGSITIHVSEESQIVSIRSIASQVGENTSEAEAKVNGSGEVTLNSRYLLDALSAFDSKEVNFRFSGKINPCVITPSDAKSADYLHIVMPLRS